MASQRESDINDFAFDYLRNHYTTQFSNKNVLVNKDEQTRHGHTTQGLFSLKKQDDTLFIASLHTKNSPLIAKALKRYKKRGPSVFRFVTSVLAMALVVVAGWMAEAFISGILLSVVLGLVIFVLHTHLEQKLLTRRIIRQLDDIKKTPANEQWLGLSISSLTFRNNYLASQLLAACERRGVGIITVGQRAKVVLLKEPKEATCRRGDFLSHYQSDERIRKALLGKSVLRVA